MLSLNSGTCHLNSHMVLQFYDDVDAEIYLEYPLFSSGAYNVTVRRTAKLEVRISNIKSVHQNSIQCFSSVSYSFYYCTDDQKFLDCRGNYLSINEIREYLSGTACMIFDA